jgi:hypothetical protein
MMMINRSTALSLNQLKNSKSRSMWRPEVELYLLEQLDAFLFRIRLRIRLRFRLRLGLKVRISRWTDHRRRKSQSPKSLWWWWPIKVYGGYRRHRRWHVWRLLKKTING